MLKDFIKLEFDTQHFTMKRVESKVIEKLADLPLVAFTVIDANGEAGKLYYDVEYKDLEPDQAAHAHPMHVNALARSFVEAMKKLDMRFDGEEYRWCGDPEAYMTSCLRWPINYKHPGDTSIIHTDRVILKLPQTALLMIVDKTDNRLDVTAMHNRYFLLHVLMMGHVNFFGEEKIWLLHHPHMKFTDVSIPSPHALINEVSELLFKQFGFMRDRVEFGQEISRLIPV